MKAVSAFTSLFLGFFLGWLATRNAYEYKFIEPTKILYDSTGEIVQEYERTLRSHVQRIAEQEQVITAQNQYLQQAAAGLEMARKGQRDTIAKLEGRPPIVMQSTFTNCPHIRLFKPFQLQCSTDQQNWRTVAFVKPGE